MANRWRTDGEQFVCLLALIYQLLISNLPMQLHVASDVGFELRK